MPSRRKNLTERRSFMKRVLKQIREILTRKQQRGVLLLMAGGLFLALLDTVTVALMAPFILDSPSLRMSLIISTSKFDIRYCYYT